MYGHVCAVVGTCTSLYCWPCHHPITPLHRYVTFSVGHVITPSLHCIDTLHFLTTLCATAQPVLQPVTFPALTQGDPYVAICQIKGGDQPIQFSWYKNGRLITDYSLPTATVKVGIFISVKIS